VQRKASKIGKEKYVEINGYGEGKDFTSVRGY